MVSILMVDDHKAVLSGTKMLLESHGMQVTTCYSGIDALEILKEHSFDVMIYDLKMPDMNGLELTKKTLEIYPDATIIILSGENIAENFDILVSSGVSGIIDKSCSDSQLITGIHMAMEKMMILPLDLVRKLTTNKNQTNESSSKIEEPLTDIELEILQQAAAGKTNKEIADALKMVQRNVEYHLSHIYKKLNVPSRVHAIRKGISLNLIKS
ncbi:MAG TPA: response regulator transcription factor [Acetivibrio sp.]|jgi:two-component system competent response regulator ComA|nr:response regulator transcription factor [Clostridium sp.]HPT91870.1 response regulator transcription factor [Acetivibrio sp.]HQA56421.1 response regulator transcription factor [Acetivibrio sp.]